MPRRLSDIEYATFLTEINVFDLNLPPWGGIVQWGTPPNETDVLVFIGAKLWNDVAQDYVTQIFLTDVSDMSDQWKAQAQQKYSDAEHVFWWSLGEGILTEIYNDAQRVGAVIGTAIDSTGKLVAGVGSLGQNLNTLLLVTGIGFIVYMVMYGRKT